MVEAALTSIKPETYKSIARTLSHMHDGDTAAKEAVVGFVLSTIKKKPNAAVLDNYLRKKATSGNITNNPNVRHTSSFRQHVSIERKQNIASLFGNRSQGLKLNNTELKEIPNSANKVNTTRVLDSSRISDAQLKQDVFAYAKQLGEGKEFTERVPGQIWNIKTPDGATINVRSKSTTELPDGSKPRWTIEIVNDKRLQSMIKDKSSSLNRNRELKFK